MVLALLKAKVLYFDSTASGTIINRFSNDIGVADNTITATISDCFDIFISSAIFLAMTSYLNPWFLIAAFAGKII